MLTRLPWLMNWPGTNTTGISARASMDFPLQQATAITRTLLTTTNLIISNRKKDSNGNQLENMAFNGLIVQLISENMLFKI
jgi:hypothetical protein